MFLFFQPMAFFLIAVLVIYLRKKEDEEKNTETYLDE
jgi:hypothetical protein